MSIPDAYIEPTGYQPTDNPILLKPTFGSVGSQHVRFEVHEEFCSEESVTAGKEIRRPVEICLIQNDRFCTVPLRVGGKAGVTSELTREQQVVLAPIYERFKTQKDSNETDIVVWDAISDMERRQLISAGIYSVEQLTSFTDEDLFRLGPGGQDLRERARRHMVSKLEKTKPNHSAEIAALRAEHAMELDRIRTESTEREERLKRLEEAYYAREAQAAKSPAQETYGLDPRKEPGPVPYRKQKGAK